MIASASMNPFLLSVLLLLGVASAIGNQYDNATEQWLVEGHVGDQWVVKDNANSQWLAEQHRQLASAAAASVLNRKLRDLQVFVIDYTPGADPDMICREYVAAANQTLECSCSVGPDKAVKLECLELSQTCNERGSICFSQTVFISLTTPEEENKIKQIETCTHYVANLENFTGSSTQFANYSMLNPCVTVIPVAPNDFSSLKSCSATMNGADCYKCEICNDNAPALGISLDCCNTNADGEQLKVDCGPVGGGGAFVPFFETYEDGQMEQCSGTADRLGGSLYYGLLVVASGLLVVSDLF